MKTNYLPVYIVSDDVASHIKNDATLVSESQFKGYSGEEVFEQLGKTNSVFEVVTNKDIFIISNLTGFILIRLEQTLYFEYSTTKRQWEVVLTDGTRHTLKKRTTSEKLLNISEKLVQVNLHIIINVLYLSRISNNQVYFIDEFESFGFFKVTRYYLTRIQERFFEY